MDSAHLTREMLELAVEREVPAWALAARLLAHLRSVCPQCAAALAATEEARGLLDLPHRLFGPRLATAHGWALVRASAALAHRPAASPEEEAVAAEALLLLWTLPSARRPDAIRRERRFQTLGLWRLLTRRSLASPPEQAEETARLAVLVALRLSPEAYPELLRRACCAEAAAALTRARVRAGALPRARTALRLAERLLGEGLAEPYAQAEMRLAEAAVAEAERRPQEAACRLREAARIFAEVKDAHREGAARIQQGLLLEQCGATREAARALARGLSLLDRERDPELADAASVSLWALLPKTEGPQGAKPDA